MQPSSSSARLLLLAAVAAATVSLTSAADEWVLAITHLDDNCLNPQRQSYFMVGKCFDDTAPLINAERNSRRFNADKTLDTYVGLGCTGTPTQVNLTVLGTCGGRHKVRKFGIPPKSVPTSNIQVTMSFPNTAVATQCDGEPRWDVTFSTLGDGDPFRQAGVTRVRFTPRFKPTRLLTRLHQVPFSPPTSDRI